MFDLDRGMDERHSRRVFLTGAGAVIGGSLLWHWRTPRVIAAVKSEPGEVTIVQFSDDGKRLAKGEDCESGEDGGGMAEAASCGII